MYNVRPLGRLLCGNSWLRMANKPACQFAADHAVLAVPDGLNGSKAGQINLLDLALGMTSAFPLFQVPFIFTCQGLKIDLSKAGLIWRPMSATAKPHYLQEGMLQRRNLCLSIGGAFQKYSYYLKYCI